MEEAQKAEIIEQLKQREHRSKKYHSAQGYKKFIILDYQGEEMAGPGTHKTWWR